jgi:hypothetical protein
MRVVVASILVLQLVGQTAHADVAKDAAQLHLDRGITAFRAGDFTLAHRELTAARDLVPHKPNPHRWLALTEVQLGDCAKALASIDAFTTRVPTDDPRLAELVRLRELCARTGVLAVTSTPPQAALRIDGAVVGTTPYRGLSMRAGSHVIVAEKPGFVAASRSIIVPAGGELAVRLDLAPSTAPITRRWWFWAATAGALAIAGTVIYFATSDDPPTLLPPIQCDPLGCQPGDT